MPRSVKTLDRPIRIGVPAVDELRSIETLELQIVHLVIQGLILGMGTVPPFGSTRLALIRDSGNLEIVCSLRVTLRNLLPRRSTGAAVGTRPSVPSTLSVTSRHPAHGQ